MAEKNIVTGQYVRIQQTPASIWDRIVARIIDSVVIIVFLVGAFYFVSMLPSMPDNVEMAVMFIIFLPVLL